MKKSDDQLAIFENQLRNEGEWCDVSAHQHLTHYFVCRSAKSTIAISLCGALIVDISKLHLNTVSQKCLACALYLDARKETKGKLFHTLQSLTSQKLNQINQTNKE